VYDRLVHLDVRGVGLLLARELLQLLLPHREDLLELLERHLAGRVLLLEPVEGLAFRVSGFRLRVEGLAGKGLGIKGQS